MAKRHCKVCGAEYNYCPGCPEYANEPKWRMNYDTENCKEIFDTLVKQQTGKITIKSTRRKLLRLDLSQKDNFNPDIRKHLESVLNTPVEPKKETTEELNSEATV